MSLARPSDSGRSGWVDAFLYFLGAKMPRQLEGASAIFLQPQYLVDIHTHVSMKLNIWGKKFWNRHRPVPGDGLMSMLGVQVDYHQLICGRVGVMVVPHDIPVGAMRRKFGSLSRVIRFLNRFFDKMEHEDFSNFTQINAIINLFEEQVYITNRKLGCETFVIARSYAELEAARKQGKIVFIHAIEGSHALGRNLPPSPQYYPRRTRKGHVPVKNAMIVSGNNQRYLDNLVALKHRGVCMLTLAYLFPNELSDCVEGIAEYPKRNTFRVNDPPYDPNNPATNKGLTNLGVEVVNKMLEIGMIIDLTHSTPTARNQVYALNKQWALQHPEIGLRPLTFSHAGSRALFESYQKKASVTCYDHHKYYGVSEQDIIEIEKTGGVIGIIIENWWLTGVDPRLSEYEGWELSGIRCVWETIQSINDQTNAKDFSCISIGTDFDGFTDTPPDLYLYEQFGELLEHLRSHISETQIERIFRSNALRMLDLGWK